MEETPLIFCSSIVGSQEWEKIEKKEFSMGPDQLLDEILEKKIWSNAEIAWVLKRMIFFYGGKDELLKQAPMERIFSSMVDVLRCFYLVLDGMNPEIDDNMRSYISNKLTDATWGINKRTREYLYKVKEKNRLT
ncbi:MAG: hypothetical protein ACOX0E_00785 [Syntrophomonadaceae bacterium]|jgi:hypothetical protein